MPAVATSGVRKLLQRQLYSFVGSTWGIALVVVCIFLVGNTALQLLQIILRPTGPGVGPGCMHCSDNDFADNLVESSFEGRLCLPKVDIVYTWVNGSDPRLQADLEYWRPRWLQESGIGDMLEAERVTEASENTESTMSTDGMGNELGNGSTYVEEVISGGPTHGAKNRFRDNEELRYSLRSIWKFAPWVHHVYIVTNGQVPHWLDLEHPRITVVPHSTILPAEHLPTFSSPAIESGLHKIPGLADHFIYFNDDVMLGSQIWPDDFYSHARGQKVFLSWEVPNCAQGCPDSYLSDTFCDLACNTSSCQYDGGACLGPNVTTSRYGSYNDYNNYEDSSGYCKSGCPSNWLGDKVCDSVCNDPACGYDLGDCGVELLEDDVTIPSFWLTANMEDLVLPFATNVLYLNLSARFIEDITEASADNGDHLFGAAILNKQKVLIIALKPQDAQEAKQSEGNVTKASPPQHFNLIVTGKNNESFISVELNFTRLTMPSSSFSDEVIDTKLGAVGINMQVKAPPQRTTDSPTLYKVTATPPPTSFVVVTIASLEATNTTLVGGAAAEGADLNTKKKKKKNHKKKDGKGRIDKGVRRLLGGPWDWGDADAFPSAESVRQYVRVEAIPSAQESGEIDMVTREFWSDAQMEEVAWITDQKQKQLMLVLIDEADAHHRRVMDEVEAEFGLTYPWDVSERLEQLEQDFEVVRAGGSRRLLMDTFADSLRWVNGLYNEVFGKSSRKVPAHMPHFVDKKIMEELHSKWPEHFYNTTSHKFRHPQDMQFAFTYMYYLIHAPVTYDPWEVFQQLDRDGDGYLDFKETELMCLLLNADDRLGNSLDPPFVYNALNSFSTHFRLGNLLDVDLGALRDKIVEKFSDAISGSSISNGTETISAPTPQYKKSTISYSIFIRTTELQERMQKAVEKKKKFKLEEENLDQVEFFMVGNDYDKVKKRLDELRQKGPKFICLNDDMNKTHDPEPKLLGALQDFYTGYFPLPCPFEHPDGVTNDFLYLEDSHYGKRWGYVQGTSYPRTAVLLLLALGMLGLVLPNSLRLRIVLFIKRECCSDHRIRPRFVAV
jgi:UDP-N-acetylglucosamine-lysosomal-enzyme